MKYNHEHVRDTSVSQLNYTAILFVYQLESYVAHIRGLLEEREGLAAEYERHNEQLQHELHQIQHQLGEFFTTVVQCVGHFFPLGYTLALLTSGNVLCNYYVAVEHHLFVCGGFL